MKKKNIATLPSNRVDRRSKRFNKRNGRALPVARVLRVPALLHVSAVSCNLCLMPEGILDRRRGELEKWLQNGSHQKFHNKKLNLDLDLPQPTTQPPAHKGDSRQAERPLERPDPGLLQARKGKTDCIGRGRG